jgi:hypothetical protein
MSDDPTRRLPSAGDPTPDAGAGGPADPPSSTTDEEAGKDPWYRQPTVVLPIVVVAIFAVVGVVALLGGDPPDPAPGSAEELEPAEEDALQPDPEQELEPEAADPEALDPEPGGDPPPASEVEPGDPDVDTPEPVEFSGDGDASETFTHEGGLARFELDHDGDGAFTVELDGETLADGDGEYDGSRVMGLAADDYDLEVRAAGTWTITASQPRPTMGAGLPAELSGDSDTGSEPLAHDGGPLTLTVSSEGDDGMVLVIWSADGEESLGLLDDEGPFEEREAPLQLPDGIFVLDVVADGEWSILVE